MKGFKRQARNFRRRKLSKYQKLPKLKPFKNSLTFSLNGKSIGNVHWALPLKPHDKNQLVSFNVYLKTNANQRNWPTNDDSYNIWRIIKFNWIFFAISYNRCLIGNYMKWKNK